MHGDIMQTASLSSVGCAVDSEVAKGLEAGGSLAPLQVPKPKTTKSWALTESNFAEGLVGGKSGNLARLRGKLPDWVHVPASVALPFGTCERAIADPANKEAAQAIKAAQQDLVRDPEQPY